MDAEHVRRFAQIPVALMDHLRDEALLELAPGVFVVDPARHHFVDELLEQLMHGTCPP